MANLEPVLGGDDTIRRNFSKIEDLYVALEAVRTQLDALDEAVAAWRPMAGGRGATVLAPAVGAGTYLMMSAGGTLVATAANYAATGTPAGLVAVRSADFAVTGKTTQLRVLMITNTNGTDDTRTVTAGLYPYTHTGAAGLAAINFGTVVSGSTVAVDSATNDERIDDSGAFTLPSDGPYCLGIVISGAGAANSIRGVDVQLQMRHT